jgi:hypothetical protein
MPDTEWIVASLSELAGAERGLAAAWHVLSALMLLALFLGWRPSKRAAGRLLCAPLASVSALAFAYGNPFNGGVFAALALLLCGLAGRLRPQTVERGPAWSSIVGVGMLALGLVYPHFLPSNGVMMSLLWAPTGVIPCPTLALVIGAALLGNGLSSRAWSMPLSIAGLFYGLYGALRLGIRLDLALVAGGAALFVLAVRSRTRRRAALTSALDAV